MGVVVVLGAGRTKEVDTTGAGRVLGGVSGNQRCWVEQAARAVEEVQTPGRRERRERAGEHVCGCEERVFQRWWARWWTGERK